MDINARHDTRADSMHVDCRRCPVQGIGCGDCMITALLDPGALSGADPELSRELALDRDERAALGRLVATGLISAETATRARAQREPWSEWAAIQEAAG